MPEYALWTLVVSFAALAFGIAVKSATTSHRLQMADKELNALITQIASLKQEHEKTVSSLSELHNAERDKVIKAYDAAIQTMSNKIVHLEYPKNALATYNNALSSPARAFVGLGKKHI